MPTNSENLASVFSDIADAIREKGVTGTMTPAQMPAKILQIIEANRYGMTIDNKFGNVNASGALQPPTGSFSISSDKITSISGLQILRAKFKGNTNIIGINLPNLTTIGEQNMYEMCYKCTNLTSINLHNLTTIGTNGMNTAFWGCTSLATLDMPNLTTIGDDGLYSAFSRSGLSGHLDLSKVTSIGSSALRYFIDATSVTSVDMSNLASIPASGLNNAFYGCTTLKVVKLKKLSTCGSGGIESTFQRCTALEEVDFRDATSVPALYSTSAFTNTNSTYKIVVPDALYDTWRAASNWSNSAIQPRIVKASENPETTLPLA